MYRAVANNKQLKRNMKKLVFTTTFVRITFHKLKQAINTVGGVFISFFAGDFSLLLFFVLFWPIHIPANWFLSFFSRSLTAANNIYET